MPLRLLYSSSPMRLSPSPSPSVTGTDWMDSETHWRLRIPRKYFEEDLEALSVSSLLKTSLPQEANDRVEFDFSGAPPTACAELEASSEPTSRQFRIQLPHQPKLQYLKQKLSRAIREGKTSIIRLQVSERCLDYLPLWVVPFWCRVLPAVQARRRWIPSIEWIDQYIRPNAPDDHQFKTILQGLDDMLGTMSWCRVLYLDEYSLQTYYFPEILSNGPISSVALDAIFHVLAVEVDRLNIDGFKVIGMDIMWKLQTQKRTRKQGDGDSKRLPYSRLQKIENQISQDKDSIKRIIFPWHLSINHWVLFEVDFERGIINCADSRQDLNMCYKEGLPLLIPWLAQLGYPNIRRGKALLCAVQDDDFSCAVVVWNTVEHYIFNKPLWTPPTKHAQRALCALSLYNYFRVPVDEKTNFTHMNSRYELIRQEGHLPITIFSNFPESPVDLLWYTPWACSAVWRSPAADWQSFKWLSVFGNNGTLHSAAICSAFPRRMLLSLIEKARRFDLELSEDMQKSVDANFTLANAAFCKSISQSPSLHDMKFLHGAFLAVLMDRILYFTNLIQAMASVQEQIPSSESPGYPEEIALQYVDAAIEFEATIRAFLRVWKHPQALFSHNATGSSSRMLVEAAPSTALQSLAFGLSRSLSGSHLARVRTNFMLAALALRFLALPPDASHERVPAAKVIAQVTGLPKDDPLWDYMDKDFYRALYLFLGLSPLVLLGDFWLGRNGRLPLYKLLEATTYKHLANFKVRARFELPLWNLVIKMAAEGAHVYECEMSKILLAYEKIFPPMDPTLVLPAAKKSTALADAIQMPLAPTSLTLAIQKSVCISIQSIVTLKPAGGRSYARKGRAIPWLSSVLESAWSLHTESTIVSACNEGLFDTTNVANIKTFINQGHAASIVEPIATNHTGVAHAKQPEVAEICADAQTEPIVSDGEDELSELTDLSDLSDLSESSVSNSGSFPLDSIDDPHIQVDGLDIVDNEPDYEFLQETDASFQWKLKYPGSDVPAGSSKKKRETKTACSRKKRRAGSRHGTKSKSGRAARKGRMRTREISLFDTDDESDESDDQDEQARISRELAKVKEMLWLADIQRGVWDVEPLKLSETLKAPKTSLIIKAHRPMVSANGSIVWKENTWELPRFRGLADELASVAKVVAQARPIHDKAFCKLGVLNSVVTMTHEEFNAKSPAYRRQLFARHTIHLIGEPKEKTLEHIVDLNDWEGMNMAFDMLRPYAVHDLARVVTGKHPNARIRRATLTDFFAARNAQKRHLGGQPRILNFLDINMTASSVRLPSSLLEDGSQYAFSQEVDYEWKSPWPTQAFLWALLATRYAISNTHIDAGGFATHIRVIHGLKLWAVQLEPQDPGRQGWDEDDTASWQLIVLGPQEDLFMRPGTPHLVVTLDDCLAIGGHFYNRETLTASLRSMIWEHCLGSSLTNTEHMTSPLVLFKLINAYKKLVLTSPSERILKTVFPSPSELAALIVIVRYSDQLEPELNQDSWKAWQQKNVFTRDHAYALKAVVQILGKLHPDTLKIILKFIHQHETMITQTCQKLKAFRNDSDEKSEQLYYRGPTIHSTQTLHA